MPGPFDSIDLAIQERDVDSGGNRCWRWNAYDAQGTFLLHLTDTGVLDLKRRNPSIACSCICCDQVLPTVEGRDSMTQYEWDRKGPDPNRDLLLCPDCAQRHEEDMKAQWAEYWSGRL